MFGKSDDYVISEMEPFYLMQFSVRTHAVCFFMEKWWSYSSSFPSFYTNITTSNKIWNSKTEVNCKFKSIFPRLYRRGVVIFWLNYLILGVDLCGSFGQHPVKHAFNMSSSPYFTPAILHPTVSIAICLYGSCNTLLLQNLLSKDNTKLYTATYHPSHLWQR